MGWYGGYSRKTVDKSYEIDIDKDVKVDLDYDTDADWNFDIDVDKEVDKDIDIDVDVKSDVDLDGHYAQVDFLVEDVAKYGDDVQFEILNVADATQGVSIASFATYDGYVQTSSGIKPNYTSDISSQAVGEDTFAELIITYEKYDGGFVASGSAEAAAE